jgi:hypothetical protein
MNTAEKLRANLAALDITTGEETLHITASFGVAARDASTAGIDDLLAAADKALYQAKSSGRNRIVAAAPPPTPRAPRHRVLKSGTMVFNGGTAVVNCTVRAMSDDGAMLEVSSTVGVPKHFTLVIKADGFSRACRVDTQTERQLDVSFEAA